MNNNKSVEVNLSVPFHDLDPLRMVWHGNYFKYFDIARFKLFNEAGVDLQEYFKKTNFLFPIIKTSTKYIFSLKYNDEFVCKASVADARMKIVIDFEIRLAENGMVCARGRSDQVAVKAPEMEMMLKIPDDVCIALGCEP